MKEKLLKVTTHKATIAALGFIAGLGASWSFNALKPAPRDPLAELFAPMEPLKELSKWQEQIFAEAPLFRTSSADPTLEVVEDENSIYYDINVPDMKNKDVQVRIEDGLVVVQGKSEHSSEEQNQSLHFSSSFHKSYPWPQGVPPGLDATKVKIKYESDKVRVEFPKEDTTRSYT